MLAGDITAAHAVADCFLRSSKLVHLFLETMLINVNCNFLLTYKKAKNFYPLAEAFTQQVVRQS
jgi:hypothetical protein